MDGKIFLQGITVNELAQAIAPLLKSNSSTNPVQDVNNNELLTREEVCKLLSISKTTLWKKTKSGELISYAIGNRILYKKVEVLKSLQLINY